MLAPTREVAQQTATAARSLRSAFKLRTVTLFGGASKQEQAALLESGPQLLVASPGRLLDLMEDGAVSLGESPATCICPLTPPRLHPVCFIGRG